MYYIRQNKKNVSLHSCLVHKFYQWRVNLEVRTSLKLKKHLKCNHPLISKRVIFYSIVELLETLNERNFFSSLWIHQNAQSVLNNLGIVHKHVTVYVQHKGSIGHQPGDPCLHILVIKKDKNGFESLFQNKFGVNLKEWESKFHELYIS